MMCFSSLWDVVVDVISTCLKQLPGVTQVDVRDFTRDLGLLLTCCIESPVALKMCILCIVLIEFRSTPLVGQNKTVRNTLDLKVSQSSSRSD